jgi:hypothetical protein
LLKSEVTFVPPYIFLSALPALLGLAGFVLYQVLGANRGGDEISRRIIEKIRNGEKGEVSPDQRLTPKQVERLLEQRHRLRELVGEHDFRLLKQALTQQFTLTIFVYVLALGFCGWSVYLFVQSPPVLQEANGATAPNVPSSSGKNGPNVNSSGIAPAPALAKPDEKKPPAVAEPKPPAVTIPPPNLNDLTFDKTSCDRIGGDGSYSKAKLPAMALQER